MSAIETGLTTTRIDELLESGNFAALQEALAAQRAEEIRQFADQEPSDTEIERLKPHGRTFFINDGGVSTPDAIALRARDLVDEEPDLTVLISRGGRILVLRPDDRSADQMVKYESASKGGRHTALHSPSLEGGDIASIIYGYPGQIGARVLYDSAQGPEASEIRKALLQKLARDITNQPVQESFPAGGKTVFAPVDAPRKVDQFRRPVGPQLLPQDGPVGNPNIALLDRPTQRGRPGS